MAEIVVALLVFHALRPLEEVGLLLLGLLCEQVVGQAHGDLPGLVELLDDFVVLRIVLETAACVDHAGHAQAVQLAHEVARGVDLIVQRQLGALGQRRVENRRVRLGDQQTGRVAVGVARDLAARWLRRVLGVAHGAQCGGVEQGAVVQVQQKHRRVGRNRIDFLDGRQAFFDELVFGETTHHAHPLRRGRVGDLALEHVHRIGQRTHAVPAQFKVVVQPAANHVRVVVEQAGHHAAALQVDLARAAGRELDDFLVRADGQKFAILDRHRRGHRLGPVERGDLPVEQNHIGRSAGATLPACGATGETADGKR